MKLFKVVVQCLTALHRRPKNLWKFSAPAPPCYALLLQSKWTAKLKEKKSTPAVAQSLTAQQCAYVAWGPRLALPQQNFLVNLISLVHTCRYYAPTTADWSLACAQLSS